MEELAWLLYRVRYGGEQESACLVQAKDALSRLASLVDLSQVHHDGG